MTRRKVRLLTVAVVGFVFLSWCGQASAAYWAEYHAMEDGHLKMWWTKDGLRISEHPFVDNDLTKFSYRRYKAPADAINDHDQQWIRSDITSETKAVAGLAPLGSPSPYLYDRFEDYLTDYGPSVTWLTLRDQADSFDVSVQVDLVAWGDYLRTGLPPDPEAFFEFEAGKCAALPGYLATYFDTQNPFSGWMVAVGQSSLVVPEPASLSLLGLGLAWLIARRRRLPSPRRRINSIDRGSPGRHRFELEMELRS